MTNERAYADDLKEARKNAGLTQQAVCDALGVAKSTYEKWEMGTRVPPQYAKRLIIEEILRLGQ